MKPPFPLASAKIIGQTQKGPLSFLNKLSCPTSKKGIRKKDFQKNNIHLALLQTFTKVLLPNKNVRFKLKQQIGQILMEDKMQRKHLERRKLRKEIRPKRFQKDQNYIYNY